MKKLADGAKVTWVAKMHPVPHPEGKTDRDGNILPVLRDKVCFGEVIRVGSKDEYWVMLKDRNYSLRIKANILELVD